jgi:hypothetical protein
MIDNPKPSTAPGLSHRRMDKRQSDYSLTGFDDEDKPNQRFSNAQVSFLRTIVIYYI